MLPALSVKFCSRQKYNAVCYDQGNQHTDNIENIKLFFDGEIIHPKIQFM